MDEKEMADFWEIDTTPVSPERVSDEKLLMRVNDVLDGLPGGWGIIAELAKRYAKEKGISRDDVPIPHHTPNTKQPKEQPEE